MHDSWTFDERSHAGEEHLEPEQVERYDEKIPFDPSAEIDLLLDHGLAASDTVVDFGAGTGAFAIAVADHCERSIAVDVSKPMLDVAREKARSRGVSNVEFVTDGVLGYSHGGDPARAVFSKNTLHHLPDFWKVEALKTVASTLEPGGIFRLRDLVFSFDPWESVDEIESWLDGMADSAFTERELHDHFRNEYSTYGVLLEGMLEAVGFDLLDVSYSNGFYGAYTCRWSGRN